MSIHVYSYVYQLYGYLVLLFICLSCQGLGEKPDQSAFLGPVHFKTLWVWVKPPGASWPSWKMDGFGCKNLSTKPQKSPLRWNLQIYECSGYIYIYVYICVYIYIYGGGGFLSHRGYCQSSSILDWDFPWTKPSSYWVPPWRAGTPYV